MSRRGKMIRISKFVVFSLALLALASTAFANEATWNYHGDTSATGPRSDTPLVLEREVVRIDDDAVRAQFWVKNPTDEDLTVTMGFPIDVDFDELRNHHTFGDPSQDWSKKEITEALKEVADAHKELTVSQNGEALSTTLHIDAEDTEYPVVFLWTATYPAGELVHDVVEHPLFYNEILGPFNQFYRTLTYITHTGSHWAAPIGHARFEWCDGLARQYVHRGPSWERYSEDRPEWCTGRRVSVAPDSYEKDREAGCLIWEFDDWTPRRDTDDIRISERGYTDQFCGLGAYPEPEPDGGGIWYVWCNLRSTEPAPQLAEELEITTRELSDEFLESALRKSIEVVRAKEFQREPEQIFASDNEYQEHLDRHPDYIQTTAKLRLYRYLRNYFFALRGHEFQDETLARCFQDLDPNNEEGTSERAKNNISFLLEREKELQEQLQQEQQAYLAAWAEIDPTPRPEPPAQEDSTEDDSLEAPTSDSENSADHSHGQQEFSEPNASGSNDSKPQAGGCSGCAMTGNHSGFLWVWLLPGLLLWRRRPTS